MNKKIISGLALSALCGGLIFVNSKTNKNSDEQPQIAKPGMVAYAASYSDDYTSEPKYSTQNNKTFKYLNLGTTLNYYRGDAVKVGIIDSGINYDHEDFMVNSKTKVKGDSKYFSYTGSSWVYYGASSHGYSYIDDTLGHGTNVAATVASAINGIGGLGLAPNVELYVYKVTNSSNGYEFGAIQTALIDAKNLGLDVINMSFQSYEHAVSHGSSSMGASSGCSTILSYYLNQAYNAGITLVGAAGNYNTSEPSYPGSNDHVINVGSLNETGTDKASFSNYGSTIDIVAPGYVYVADEASNTAYTNTQGTSFSAPLVTAAIALYIQQNPSATPAQIEQALYNSCDEIDDSGSQYTNWAGHGALNVANFLGITDGYPTSIDINNPEIVNDELTLEVGDTFSLDWTVNGTGTFNDDVDIYSVSDDVVSIDEDGHITALAEGVDYIGITSTFDSSVEKEITVTVTSSTTPSNKLVVGKNGAFWKDEQKITSASRGSVTYTALGGSNDGKYYASDKTWRFSTSGNSGFKITAPSGCGINSVVLEWSGTQFSTPSGVTSSGSTSPTTYTVSNPFTNELSFYHSGSGYSALKSATVTYSTFPSLSTISIQTAPSKLSYTAGETFDPTGLVINRNYSGDYSDTYTYANHTSEFTFSPSGALTTSNTSITITYGGKSCTQNITVSPALTPETLTITRSSFNTTGGYAWYDWSATTSSSNSILGKAEIFATTTASMQFNKSNGSGNAALFNTTAIPGSITKIEATTASGTNRAWNAYVSSTAYSVSGTSLTPGSNNTQIGNGVTVTTSSTSLGTSSAGYSYFCIKENVTGASYLSQVKITYTPKSISSIEVKTVPSKTIYEAGEYFDPTGLVITATYSDNSSADIAYSSNNSSSFTFNPSLLTALKTTDESVTITYGNKTCSQAITVNTAVTLTSVSISEQTTQFVEGDAFSFGGVVTAHYSNSTSANVTSEASFTGYNMSETGQQTVTVSYTYKNHAESTSYNINVIAGTPVSLSVSGQTTVYVKNATFSFDGTCTVTFANNYQKAVTPTTVTSPDMTTSGNKTVTVTYTYNNVTVSTTYNIVVNAYRTVMEEVSTSTTVGSAIYKSGSEVLSSGISKTTTGSASVENNALKLGSGSKGGSITYTLTSSFNKVVISAKRYGSDSTVLSLGGQNCTLTSSYQEFTKTYSTTQTSITISTPSSNRRAYVETVYFYLVTASEQDIGQSEDCLGLETFINTYMHMDYTSNLGYCKDEEHHYYSSAKSAFNLLNDHQRSLFVGNSAYVSEYARLVRWAEFNGDSLNTSTNKFEHVKTSILSKETNKTSTIILVVSISSLIILVGYVVLKRRKESD